MAFPPKDVSSSELFQKLVSAERPHRITDIPRKGPDGEPIAQVALVVLTQEEMNLAAAEAERRTRKLLGADVPKKEDAQSGYSDVYNNLAAVEILFRACRQADDTKRNAFRTPHEIQSALTSDEVGVLFHAYLTVQQELGPIVARMTEEEVDSWVRVLAEGGTADPLGLLSWGALTTLVLSMARRLHALQTDSFLPGSPAESDGETLSETDELLGQSAPSPEPQPPTVPLAE